MKAEAWALKIGAEHHCGALLRRRRARSSKPLASVRCRNQFYGLAIGAMAMAASYAAGPISGGLMNPAITIGADLAGAGAGFGSSLIYAAFQLPP